MIDFRSYPLGDDHPVLVVELSGRLDSDSCDYFLSCVEELIDNGATNIVIDCRGLEFISSMGLGMLLRANSRMKKRGGAVKLARLEGMVADVVKTVGLDRVFGIYPKVRDAHAAFVDEDGNQPRLPP